MNEALGRRPQTQFCSQQAVIPRPRVACASILLLLAGILGGCGAGTSNVNLPQPVQVSISPSSAFVAAQGQAQFKATVQNTPNTAVTWQVNGIPGGSTSVGVISADGLYTALASSATATIGAVSQADPSKSATATVTVLAPHRIGVRATASGLAEFYDRTAGTSFLPRGNNYIRLAGQTDLNGNYTYYHSTFNVGLYDAPRAETAFANMQANGYNAVRVWINGCCPNTIGNPAGGLSSAYIANMADFLQRAGNHGIYVIFTLDWLPSQGGYTSNYAGCTQFSDVNTLNLCAGGVAGNVSFFHDLAQALVDQGAPIESVLAYELRNEYFYQSIAPPLSWTSGTVTAADGSTYDMSDPTSRQQMMDSGLTYFTDQVRSAILAVDPTALVTVGFFWPQAPNPTRIGDTRVIEVYPAIANSTADFVDIHAYSIVGELTLPQVIQNYGFVGYQQAKPVMMGEFGASKSDYPQISDAASILKNWQLQSCPYSVKGWLLWTWDTEEPEQDPAFWAAMSGDGSVNLALAPAQRPDPCL